METKDIKSSVKDNKENLNTFKKELSDYEKMLETFHKKLSSNITENSEVNNHLFSVKNKSSSKTSNLKLSTIVNKGDNSNSSNNNSLEKTSFSNSSKYSSILDSNDNNSKDNISSTNDYVITEGKNKKKKKKDIVNLEFNLFSDNSNSTSKSKSTTNATSTKISFDNHPYYNSNINDRNIKPLYAETKSVFSRFLELNNNNNNTNNTNKQNINDINITSGIPNTITIPKEYYSDKISLRTNEYNSGNDNCNNISDNNGTTNIKNSNINFDQIREENTKLYNALNSEDKMKLNEELFSQVPKELIEKIKNNLLKGKGTIQKNINTQINISANSISNNNSSSKSDSNAFTKNVDTMSITNNSINTLNLNTKSFEELEKLEPTNKELIDFLSSSFTTHIQFSLTKLIEKLNSNSSSKHFSNTFNDNYLFSILKALMYLLTSTKDIKVQLLSEKLLPVILEKLLSAEEEKLFEKAFSHLQYPLNLEYLEVVDNSNESDNNDISDCSINLVSSLLRKKRRVVDLLDEKNSNSSGKNFPLSVDISNLFNYYSFNEKNNIIEKTFAQLANSFNTLNNSDNINKDSSENFIIFTRINCYLTLIKHFAFISKEIRNFLVTNTQKLLNNKTLPYIAKQSLQILNNSNNIRINITTQVNFNLIIELFLLLSLNNKNFFLNNYPEMKELNRTIYSYQKNANISDIINNNSHHSESTQFNSISNTHYYNTYISYLTQINILRSIYSYSSINSYLEEIRDLINETEFIELLIDNQNQIKYINSTIQILNLLILILSKSLFIKANTNSSNLFITILNKLSLNSIIDCILNTDESKLQYSEIEIPHEDNISYYNAVKSRLVVLVSTLFEYKMKLIKALFYENSSITNIADIKDNYNISNDDWSILKELISIRDIEKIEDLIIFLIKSNNEDYLVRSEEAINSINMISKVNKIIDVSETCTNTNRNDNTTSTGIRDLLEINYLNTSSNEALFYLINIKYKLIGFINKLPDIVGYKSFSISNDKEDVIEDFVVSIFKIKLNQIMIYQNKINTVKEKLNKINKKSKNNDNIDVDSNKNNNDSSNYLSYIYTQYFTTNQFVLCLLRYFDSKITRIENQMLCIINNSINNSNDDFKDKLKSISDLFIKNNIFEIILNFPSILDHSRDYYFDRYLKLLKKFSLLFSTTLKLKKIYSYKETSNNNSIVYKCFNNNLEYKDIKLLSSQESFDNFNIFISSEEELEKSTFLSEIKKLSYSLSSLDSLLIKDFNIRDSNVNDKSKLTNKDLFLFNKSENNYVNAIISLSNNRIPKEIKTSYLELILIINYTKNFISSIKQDTKSFDIKYNNNLVLNIFSFLMLIIKFNSDVVDLNDQVTILPHEESLLIDILKSIILKEKISNSSKIISSSSDSSTLNVSSKIDSTSSAYNSESLFGTRKKFKEIIELFINTFFSENISGQSSTQYKSKFHYRILMLICFSNIYGSFSQSLLNILSTLLFDDYLNIVFSCSILSDFDYYKFVLVNRNKEDYLIKELSKILINMKIKYQKEELIQKPSAISSFTDYLLSYEGYESYDEFIEKNKI